MDRRLEVAVGSVAILGPGLHLGSDVLEWSSGGFTPLQLWMGYVAFASIPSLMIGLYAVQHGRVARIALAGAVLYGISFIYFAHSSLYALVARTADYPTMWDELGGLYTAHGAMMILGGVLFGLPTLKAGVLPRWTSIVFLAGLALNAAIAALPVDPNIQALGNDVRNIGLIGMGVALSRPPPSPDPAAD